MIHSCLEIPMNGFHRVTSFAEQDEIMFHSLCVLCGEMEGAERAIAMPQTETRTRSSE